MPQGHVRGGVVISISLRLRLCESGPTHLAQLHSHFPASSGALEQHSLHRQNRAIRTAFQNLRRVDVGVFTMTTPSTNEQRLRVTRRCVDVAACTALLRAECGRHLNERAAKPRQFVAQHVVEDRPPSVADATRAVSLYHTRDVQFLDNDDAVVLSKSRGLDMQMVSTLTPYLAVEASDTKLGFGSVARAFLLTGDGTLSMSDALEGSFEMLRVIDEIATGRRAEMHNTAIYCDDRFSAISEVWDPDLTYDHREPLIRIADERAGLARTFERTMNNNAHRAELWEVQRAVCPILLVDVESPDPGVRLAQADNVLALTFPTWRFGEFPEAALPGVVKLDEQLAGDIARDVGKPRQFGAQLGHLALLIENGRVAAFAFCLGVVREQALFVRDVPKKTQCVAPRIESRSLPFAGIDTKTECLIYQHQIHCSRAVRQLNLRPGTRRPVSAS